MIRNKEKGFTLVEVLISMVIFAVISIISYSTLNSSSRHRILQQEHSQKTLVLQKTLLFIKRDMSQIFNQQIVVDDLGLSISSVQNDILHHIRYKIEDKKLIRQDITNLEKIVTLELIDEVDKFKLRLLDNENKWFKKWPQKNTYIKAMEIEFEHPYWQYIKQVVMIDE